MDQSAAPQAAHASAPAIPFKHDAGTAAAPLAGGALGVLLVSLVAIAAVLVVRKKMGLVRAPAGKPTLLKVLETQRLGPRALLSVVEFAGSQYLIAQGEHGISCVASKALEERP